MAKKQGEFIWADLSTYDPIESIQFYKSVFDWELTNSSGYYISTIKDSIVAGIYETPAFFKKIKMPHFWMSYFQVGSALDTSKIAEAHGGKVEINDIEFYNGKISLIRDPLGAGFTIYDGDDLQFSKDGQNSSIVQTELHASDLNKVMPFYSALFNWEYKDLKGKFEYWVLTFKVGDLESTTQRMTTNGGQIISDEKNKLLSSDNSNEAFFYIRDN